MERFLDKRVLMIVESPNKIRTLKEFLPKNFVIVASVGHISQIADGGKYYNSGIDVDNKFKANYILSPTKTEVVTKLKEQIKLADVIIIATDGDREGELIAYMLKTLLKVPESKYERITFQEITKTAVLKALAAPRKIDENVSASAMTRARLDKLTGYMLSPVARRAVQAKSVGRCQSAGLKVIVDRELEIQNFKSADYFELFLDFNKNKITYKSKYVGTETDKVANFNNEAEVIKVVNECKATNKYILSDITEKDRNVFPKAPFTTSTFQQEVSNKLGISVKQSMAAAQKLFEGIDIAGKHIGLITYIRTDSTAMSPEFEAELANHVKASYGNKYYSPVKKAKKKDLAQEGHECLRVSDLTMTPDILEKYVVDEVLLKVYAIIYKRTVAASMSSALVTDTTYTIANGKHRFAMATHELKFDGFRKIYDYKEDDEELASYSGLVAGEELKEVQIYSEKKSTKPPKRFSEAGFVSMLEKLGIGRPSTYASILATITDTGRGYCNVETKALIPTEKGIQLIQFLDKEFPDIVNSSYTSKMEESLDLIANNKLNDVLFLTEFYKDLEGQIKKVDPVSNQQTDKVCSKCGSPMVIKSGRYGPFLACSAYPKCRNIESLKK